MLHILLGKVIKSKRLALNMKQITLANYLNVNQSAISKMENGIQEPTLEQLCLLKQNLNISIDKLINSYVQKK